MGMAELMQSRIDDILMSSTIYNPSATQALDATDDSDHLPLITQIDLGAIGFIPLECKDFVPQNCNQPRFVMPMKKEQLLDYQSQLLVAQGQQIFALKRKIAGCLDILEALPVCQTPASSISDHNILHAERLKAAKEHGISNQIQELALDMEVIWQAALHTARQTCELAQPRPCKKFLTRGDKRKLMDLISQGKKARADYEACKDGSLTKHSLHETLRQLKKERKALTKDIRKHEAQSRRDKFQALFDQKQKVANALINNKKGERIEPNTLKHPTTNEILFKQPEVLAETQRYFQDLNKPPAGIKNQKYLPAEAPRSYPWGATDALDSFELETHVGQEAYKFINLDDHIRDQTSFQQCLRNTKLGKAPGPDQVSNELLRYLPISMQDALHKFMMLM